MAVQALKNMPEQPVFKASVQFRFQNGYRGDFCTIERGVSHSVKKTISVILMSMVLFFSCSSLAEYGKFDFPGNISHVAFSDGVLYVQAEADYPASVLYKYSPLLSEEPELVFDQLETEMDHILVTNGQAYTLRDGKNNMHVIQNMAAHGDKKTIQLFPETFADGKRGMSFFLESISEGKSLVFLMACGEQIHMCHLNTENGEFKSVNMEENLFAVQPYAEEKNLIFRSNRNNGEKEIYEFDWGTLKQTRRGTLPAEAVSIAFSKDQDVLYYMANGSLWRYQWDGSCMQIMTDLPSWTDQRAFILDSGYFVTLHSDLDETLIVIDLNSIAP